MIAEYVEQQVWEKGTEPTVCRCAPLEGVTACRYLFPETGKPQPAFLLPGHYEAVLCLAGQLSLRLNGEPVSVCSGDLLLLTGEAAIETCQVPVSETVLLTVEVDRQAVLAAAGGHLPPPFDCELDVQQLHEQMKTAKGCLLLRDTNWNSSVLSALKSLPPERHGAYFTLRLMDRLCLLSHQPLLAQVAENGHDPEQQETVRQVMQYIKMHLHEPVTIQTVARQFGMSPTSLKTLFRRISGLPLHAYMQRCRMEEAARLLATTQESVQAIAARVGYAGTSRFYVAFREWYHMTPSQYRRTSSKNV